LSVAAPWNTLTAAQPPASSATPDTAIEVVDPTPLPGYVGLPGHMNLESRRHPALNRKGYCCDSYPGSPGCSNLRETCRFVFGSCRSFFGEPCPPKPPKYLFPGARQRVD
jgi:hypothetical protein